MTADAAPNGLVDAAAREQAISDLTTCLAVEAGAGTGKTTLMVGRILHILRSGAAAVDEVLAITFTEKAAAELRSRLRVEIDRAVREAAGEERERLRAALDGFDRAQIGTIHALAGALLRERPVEARLDPAFEVLDELGEDQGFDAAYGAWLDAELNGSPPAARRALNLGLSLEHLREAARHLHAQRDLLPDDWPAPEPEPRTALLAWLQEQAARLTELAHSCRDESDNGYQRIQEVATWVDLLGRATPEAFERLLSQREKFAPAGNKQKWKPAEHCDAQKQICAEINERLAAARAALGQAATAALAQWLGGFVRGYEAERRRGGRAEFQDLLVWARDLVRDHPAVRAYFQRRFRYVLVDEFQDTDPLQVEIVFFLAAEGQEATDWREVRLVPGKLFIVGDPKQAIYRFRRADLSTYQAARDAVLACGGMEVRIAQNFRSVAPVVDWVNRTFAAVIGDGDPPYQAAYASLAPSLPPHPEHAVPPVVLLYPWEGEAAPGSARAARQREAGMLARLVRRVVEDGWPVLERQGDGVEEWQTRPARYRDIALLFGVTTDIELFEDALRAEDVPYRVEGGRLFYNRQEVRDLTNCLAALDDPADPVALVGALTSVAFAFTEEELLAFSESGGRLDYLHDPGEGWPRFRRAFALLRRLHQARVRAPMPAIVEQLLAETRMVELALLGPSGDQAAANLFKVVEQARAFGGRHGATFRGFVQWLRDNQRRPPREADSSVAEAYDDTVRLMTIHAAKGLEFPIVLLANARGSSRSEPCIVDRLHGTIDLRLGPTDTIFRTPGYDQAAEQEARHAEAEQRRLFYVAATRTRDHLVLPLFDPGAGFAALLGGCVPPPGHLAPGEHADGVWAYDLRRIAVERPEAPPFRLLIGDGPAAEAALAERRAWQEERAAVLGSPRGEVDGDA